MQFLQITFFITALIAAYAVWVHPLLKTRPAFADFFAQGDGWFEAVRLKFSSIKGKLASGIGMALSAIVGLHDFLIPIATGIDWTPIQSLMPSWAWPILLFAMFGLISYFRTLTSERQEREITAVAVGAPIADAAIIAEKTNSPAEAFYAAVDTKIAVGHTLVTSQAAHRPYEG